MTQASLISRLVQAAEDWTRRRYHQDVVAVEHGEAEYRADGSIQAIVELECRAQGSQLRKRCIAILEPDGTISCIDTGSMTF